MWIPFWHALPPVLRLTWLEWLSIIKIPDKGAIHPLHSLRGLLAQFDKEIYPRIKNFLRHFLLQLYQLVGKKNIFFDDWPNE